MNERRALAVRAAADPDRHLRRANGTFYVQVFVLWRFRRKLRLRRSLGTDDPAEARRRRDALLERLRLDPDLTLLEP